MPYNAEDMVDYLGVKAVASTPLTNILYVSPDRSSCTPGGISVSTTLTPTSHPTGCVLSFNVLMRLVTVTKISGENPASAMEVTSIGV